MKIFEGNLVSQDIKVGIVCARFNEFIVSKLLSGCEDGLLRHGVKPDDISVAWAPGAFEIPLITSKMAKSGKYDAVICLGAVIRGSYDYGAGDWAHRYIVTDFTETSMVWTAKDDRSDISVYERCDGIPEDITGGKTE